MAGVAILGSIVNGRLTVNLYGRKVHLHLSRSSRPCRPAGRTTRHGRAKPAEQSTS